MRIKEILGGWTVTIHIDCLEDNPLTNDLNHCNLVSYTITMKVCVYISFQSSKYLVCSLYYIKLLKLYFVLSNIVSKSILFRSYLRVYIFYFRNT